MAQRDQRGMTTVRATRILTKTPQLDSAQSALQCHNRTFTPQGSSTGGQYPLPSLDIVEVRVTSEGRVEVLGV